MRKLKPKPTLVQCGLIRHCDTIYVTLICGIVIVTVIVTVIVIVVVVIVIVVVIV
jgi:hypothetical protein